MAKEKSSVAASDAAESESPAPAAAPAVKVGDAIPYASTESGVMTVCAVNEAGTVVDLGYTAAGPAVVRGYVLPV